MSAATIGGVSRNHARLSGGGIQHVVQAYTTMNKFLGRFLEHALRDLDFVVKDRYVCNLSIVILIERKVVLVQFFSSFHIEIESIPRSYIKHTS